MAKANIRAIARAFVNRADAIGLKGKTRDKMALEYFLGAAAAYHASGMTEEYDHIAAVCAMVLTVRGYSFVLELANKPD